MMTQDLTAVIGDHVPRMYRVALRMVANHESAEDVVQEACVRAIRGIGRFDGRSQIATWLHRIAVNCARDHLRSRQRNESRLADIGDEFDSHVDLSAVGPAQQAEEREMLAEAWQCLDELPPECRRAFYLTQLDGYSYDEASAIEDEPRGTIASRVFRAKNLLSAKMSGHDGQRSQT